MAGQPPHFLSLDLGGRGGLSKETRKEKGNRAYDLNRDTQTPTQYLLYERWQDLPALEAHLKKPCITKLLADLGDLLAAPPESSILVPIRN